MRTILYLIAFLFILGCNNGDDRNNSDCNDIACTEEFVTTTVSVKDNTANPIALDKIMVSVSENGTDLTRVIPDFEWQLFRQNGVYPLFGDEYANDYRNMELEINFKGFINDLEVVSADFIVGADCCHVSLISGDTNLIVD